MKKAVVIASIALFVLGTTMLTSAQKQAPTQVNVKANSVAFKGLKSRDIDEVRKTLNAAVSRAVTSLSAGEVAKAKKDCKRIDLTDKQICVEITIETIDK